MKKTVPKNALLIPDNAKLVFKGTIFDVYQWPQEMFDGSSKTFEMLKRPDTVQIVGIKDGQVVVIHDEQPGREGARMHFPGGRVDKLDESWLSAAKREMLEETGMSFKTWRLIHVEQPQQKIEWFVSFFVATNFESQQEQKVDGDGERITVELRNFDELRQIVLAGDEPSLNFAISLFQKISSLESLDEILDFEGKEVDR